MWRFSGKIFAISLQITVLGSLNAQVEGENDLAAAAEKPQIPQEAHENSRNERFDKLKNERGRLLFRYARNSHADGRLRRSLDLFINFLTLYPDHPWRFEALLECSEINLELTNSDEAVKYLIDAYRLAYSLEKGGEAYLKAGQILSEMGEILRARKVFNDIIQLYPASRLERLAKIELNAIEYLHEETKI